MDLNRKLNKLYDLLTAINYRVTNLENRILLLEEKVSNIK